jgi:hypothetical protein
MRSSNIEEAELTIERSYRQQGLEPWLETSLFFGRVLFSSRVSSTKAAYSSGRDDGWTFARWRSLGPQISALLPQILTRGGRIGVRFL